jgi:hypothetical protein
LLRASFAKTLLMISVNRKLAFLTGAATVSRDAVGREAVADVSAASDKISENAVSHIGVGREGVAVSGKAAVAHSADGSEALADFINNVAAGGVAAGRVAFVGPDCFDIPAVRSVGA